MMRDNATDGTGGFAMIKEGGINFKYVKIYFKSQTGHDIRFVVDIYAQPPYVSVPATTFVQQQQHPGAFVQQQQQQPLPYPNNAAQPIGWIPAVQPMPAYPANTYQPQNPQYVFNRT